MPGTFSVPRTHTALVAAAVLLLGDLHAGVAATNVERAHPLGAVDLVAGE